MLCMRSVLWMRDAVDKASEAELFHQDQVIKTFQGFYFTVFTAFDKLAEKHFFPCAGGFNA